MLRMSKLTDYGTVVLTCLADQHRRSAADVAVNTRLAVPTVSKLLKALTRAGLVVSHRGPHGGYELAREADEISAAEILDALEEVARAFVGSKYPFALGHHSTRNLFELLEIHLVSSGDWLYCSGPARPCGP